MGRHKTSATAAPASDTSMERNHGNMADSVSCCAGGHLGARILQWLQLDILHSVCYNFQVVHPRCVCQIIQYVFIVFTTLYIYIISTFVRTVY